MARRPPDVPKCRTLARLSGAGVLLPVCWVAPVVSLPAHAQTSPAGPALCGGGTLRVGDFTDIPPDGALVPGRGADRGPGAAGARVVACGAGKQPHSGRPGAGGGQIIQNTVFELIVRQIIECTVSGLDGPCNFELIRESESEDENELVSEILSALGINPVSLLSAVLLFLGGEFANVTSIEFELSDDAVIIGDLEDWPNLFVAAGTLTVTNTETLIETRRFDLDIVVAA